WGNAGSRERQQLLRPLIVARSTGWSWRSAQRVCGPTSHASTLQHPPRTRTPVRDVTAGLMGDEVREEVRQKAEKSEARNTVGGEYPGSAAFAFAGSGLLNCRMDDWGRIFQARKPPRERTRRSYAMRHARRA